MLDLIKALARRRRAISIHIRQLQGLIAAAHEERAALSQTLTHIALGSDHLTEVGERLRRFREDSSLTHAQIDAIEARLRSLDETARACGRVDARVRQLAADMAEVSRLAAHVASLEDHLQCRREDMQRVSSEVRDAQSEIDRVRADRASLAAQHETFRRHLAETQRRTLEEVDALRHRLAPLEQVAADYGDLDARVARLLDQANAAMRAAGQLVVTDATVQQHDAQLRFFGEQLRATQAALAAMRAQWSPGEQVAYPLTPDSRPFPANVARARRARAAVSLVTEAAAAVSLMAMAGWRHLARLMRAAGPAGQAYARRPVLAPGAAGVLASAAAAVLVAILWLGQPASVPDPAAPAPIGTAGMLATVSGAEASTMEAAAIDPAEAAAKSAAVSASRDGDAAAPASGTRAAAPAGGRAAAAPAARSTAGRIVVTSRPSGARVTVNGVGWGVTPVTINYLPMGQNRVRVSKDGYVSAERPVVLTAERPGRTVQLQLRARPGAARRAAVTQTSAAR